MQQKRRGVGIVSRKVQMHVLDEENANIRGQGQWTGGGKKEHIHPDRLGGNTLPALIPIAKPNAEEHIQHTEPQSGKQQRDAGATIDGKGRPNEHAGK